MAFMEVLERFATLKQKIAQVLICDQDNHTKIVKIKMEILTFRALPRVPDEKCDDKNILSFPKELLEGKSELEKKLALMEWFNISSSGVVKESRWLNQVSDVLRTHGDEKLILSKITDLIL